MAEETPRPPQTNTPPDPGQAEPSHDRSLWGRLWQYFITGLLVTAPAVLTLFIVSELVLALDNLLLNIIPRRFQPEMLLDMHLPGVGLIAGFVLITFFGYMTRNLLGRKMLHWSNAFMEGIPGVRSVYGAIKQIIETVTSGKSTSFREVVMLEYPRKGIWAIAFVSGTTKGQAQRVIDEDLVNVFLPTTPNPTSGFLLLVPRQDLVKLDMTVDQGLKMIISAGIVTPTTAEGKAAMKEEKAARKQKSTDDTTSN